MTTAGFCGAPEFFERGDLDLWGLLDGLSFLKCKRSLEKLTCGLLRSAWLLSLAQEAVSSRHRGSLIRLLHDTSLSGSSWGGFFCIFRALCFWKSNTNLSSWHWIHFFVLNSFYIIYTDIFLSILAALRLMDHLIRPSYRAVQTKSKYSLPSVSKNNKKIKKSILCSPRHFFAQKYSKTVILWNII